ncbi:MULTISPECIES: sensor histidine kinase [Pseudoalteromonas]|uniref:Sensor histidine kinase n=1 Tax=Pseudoalteromonas fuliginea TaxID=1872678 RepID=A0ABQ6RFE4_9GAMM|nr:MULTISPECIES: sensor histidine kinase [Pseudoalteromonas]KAA1152198.1 sensor histidine kinase [Pseudoalteromonas fuliginea]KAA1166295.1 sensor histidine kinase [Pseudoalteromonas fuliginea]MDQ2044606.1 sensor histidine kinase [Pseudoalteromonas sp. 20-92]
MSSLSVFSKQSDKGFWKYGHLIFTGFYLLPMIIDFAHFTSEQIVISLAFYIAFILLYVKAINCKGTGVTKLFVAMLLICFSATFYSTGTPTLFGFVAYIAGYAYSKHQRVYAALAIIFSVLLSAYIGDIGKVQYFLAIALILCAALFSYGIAARRERQYKKREQENANQLEQLAAIAERERIARDLHDILGHSLSSIALKAELANKLHNAERFEQAGNEITQVADLARALLSDVRHAVTDLKQQQLTGQVEQLKQRLEEQNIITNVTLNLPVLPAVIESELCLIIKESVTNILRHSKANQCDINLTSTKQSITLNLFNNGDCENITPGNGLTGIKQRVEKLNGQVKFEIQNGFKLTAHIPLP